MNEINIIYNWKNKEVKTILNDDEILLLIEAIKVKCGHSLGYDKLEEKIVFGLLGDKYRHITNTEDIDELKQILEMGISLNYKFQVDINID